MKIQLLQAKTAESVQSGRRIYIYKESLEILSYHLRINLVPTQLLTIFNISFLLLISTGTLKLKHHE